MLDVRVSREQKTVGGGLLPHVERVVAETELHAVAHVLDSDPVFSGGDDDVGRDAQQREDAADHGVGALPVFDAHHERRREEDERHQHVERADLHHGAVHEDLGGRLAAHRGLGGGPRGAGRLRVDHVDDGVEADDDRLGVPREGGEHVPAP